MLVLALNSHKIIKPALKQKIQFKILSYSYNTGNIVGRGKGYLDTGLPSEIRNISKY